MSLIQYAGVIMFCLAILGGFIGLPMWNVHRRSKLQDITQNKVLAIRITRVGNLWFELCPYENESAKVSKDGELEAGAALLNKDNTARTEYPLGAKETDRYLFDTEYPPTLHQVGKARGTSFFANLIRPTVSVRASVIPEGYSMGYMPWAEDNIELYTKMTDRQFASIEDQSGEKMLRATERSLEKTPSSGGLKKSDKMWALVIGLIIILLAGAGALFGYLNNTEMTSWGW
jgi:hypothetical protein